MAENIVKSIIRVFWAENSLENLEKIKPKVCKIEVIVMTENKSFLLVICKKVLIQQIINQR